MIFKKRETMSPPSPRGARVPARSPAPQSAGTHIVALRLALLLDVPEHRRRCRKDAVHVLAHRGRQVPLAEVQMRGELRVALLRGGGDLLLLARIGLARKLVAQLLDLLVARPAEHRLVAA